MAFVYRQPLNVAQIRQVESPANQIQLQHKLDLRVTYQGEQPDAQYVALMLVARRNEVLNAAKNQWQTNRSTTTEGKRPQYEPVLEVSDLRLLGPAAIIQPNGYRTNPLIVKVYGYWAFEKIGEALPLDYSPPLLP